MKKVKQMEFVINQKKKKNPQYFKNDLVINDYLEIIKIHKRILKDLKKCVPMRIAAKTVELKVNEQGEVIVARLCCPVCGIFVSKKTTVCSNCKQVLQLVISH